MFSLKNKKNYLRTIFNTHLIWSSDYGYFRIADVEAEGVNIAAEEDKANRKIKDINMRKYRNLQEYLSNTKVSY